MFRLLGRSSGLRFLRVSLQQDNMPTIQQSKRSSPLNQPICKDQSVPRNELYESGSEVDGEEDVIGLHEH